MYYDNVVLSQMYNDIIAKGKVSQEDISSLEHVANSNFITKNHKLTSFTTKASEVNMDKLVASMESFLLESNKLYREKSIELNAQYRDYVSDVSVLSERLTKAKNKVDNFLDAYPDFASFQKVFKALIPDYDKGKIFIDDAGKDILTSIRSMELRNYIDFIIHDFDCCTNLEDTIIFKTVAGLNKYNVSSSNTSVIEKKVNKALKELKFYRTGSSREGGVNSFEVINDFENLNNSEKEIENTGFKTLAYYFNRSIHAEDSCFSITDVIDYNKVNFTIEDCYKIFVQMGIVIEDLNLVVCGADNKKDREIVIPDFFTTRSTHRDDVNLFFELIDILPDLRKD